MRALFQYISCLFGCWRLRYLRILGSFVLRWCLLKDRLFASKGDPANVLAVVDDFLGPQTVVGSGPFF